jgi:succinate-semialdehyde dehydrogenase / glutarate-semialdehyde dehydrogenase
MSTSYPELALYVSGEWITSTSQTRDVLNPATDAVLAKLPVADEQMIEAALRAADAAFAPWAATPVAERAAILERAADILHTRREQAALCMTLDQGKPLSQSLQEIDNCVDLLRWNAQAAQEPTGRELPARQGFRALSVRKEPIGTVAALAPWNFPASIATRKVASALAVGCPVIVKPAEDTPGSFLFVARALHEAGVPAGALSVLYGDPGTISAQLISSPVVRKVSFTGSTSVGQLIGRQAGQYVKPAVLELGGHAPVAVFKDADISGTVARSVLMKSRNAGQICISPTRFYIEDEVYDDFSDDFAAKFAEVKVGDGTSDGVDMGPLAHDRRIDAVSTLIEDAVEQGARLVTGGKRIGNTGNFFEPTVLADVPNHARIMLEEPFGPVAILNRFSDREELYRRANSSSYALAGYIFTGSDETAEEAAARFDVGMLGINAYAATILDSPIGGRKMSGYGSEGGSEGLDAYRINKFVSLT